MHCIHRAGKEISFHARKVSEAKPGSLIWKIKQTVANMLVWCFEMHVIKYFNYARPEIKLPLLCVALHRNHHGN